MAALVILRHPVTIVVTDFTTPDAFKQNEIKKNVTTKSNRCSLFQILRELTVNRRYLRALTLVGPKQNNPVLEPLTVLHLNNQLNIFRLGIR